MAISDHLRDTIYRVAKIMRYKAYRYIVPPLLLKPAHLASSKSYRVIIDPNSHEKLAKIKIRLNVWFGRIYPITALIWSYEPYSPYIGSFLLSLHLLQNVKAIGQLLMEILHLKLCDLDLTFTCPLNSKIFR